MWFIINTNQSTIVSVSNISAGSGTIVYLPININGASSIGAMDILLIYNSTVLNVTRVSSGSLTSSSMVAYGGIPVDPSVDLNGDGNVSSIDALMALQMAIGNIPVDPRADVNRDGKVTSIDALQILQMASTELYDSISESGKVAVEMAQSQ